MNKINTFLLLHQGHLFLREFFVVIIFNGPMGVRNEVPMSILVLLLYHIERLPTIAFVPSV